MHWPKAVAVLLLYVFVESNMDEKKAKERENVQGNQDNPSCAFIILPHEVNNFADIWFLKEKVERESTGGWTRPIIHGNVFTMQTFQARSKLLVLQILETIAKATFQTIPNINFSTKDFSEGSCNCACDDNFLILENIFHLNLSQCLIVRTCQGKAYLSIGTKVKPIPIEDFYHLDALFIEMSGTKEAISNLLVKNIRMDEIGQKDPCLNGLITDHNLLKEVSELKYQYRKSDTQVQEIKQKLCAKINISIKQNGFDKHSSSDTPLQGEASTSRAHTLTQNIEHLSNNNSLVKHTYSLPRLLLSISRRLSLTDWDKLRCIVTNHVPERVLENIENGVKVLEELVNRNFINHGNLEFLRGILYEIKRVDLVHLVDCIEKGDYSLLNEKKSQGPRNSTQTKENTSISNGLPPHQNMQNLSLQTNHLVVDTLATRGDQPVTMTTNGNSATPRDDVMLQRKYKDLPRTSQVSPSYPIQENSANAIVSDSNEGAVTSGANTAMTRAETSASHEPTTSDSDSRHVGQAMGAGRDTSTRDQDSVGKTTWDKNPGFPCDHYERHCEVQFSCCEKFWPCHRCHNSESSCESRTLRSRDIKNVKCLRCGKVQQFPKETGHCVECNLKFAEYFCSICQHLTGTQSHPYHCEKCGICRVHGNRSFHCDICGVCLDVNLRNDHKCRAGSAHDECCICFEDAFTGCQILPCSHKVHKECASLMLQNKITKCPICRESFEHKIERRPIP